MKINSKGFTKVMSARKPFKSFLINAEYLMVLMKSTDHHPKVLSYSGLHIPSKRFTGEMKKVAHHLSNSMLKIEEADKAAKIKTIFASPEQISINHIKDEEFETNHTLKIAQMTSLICHRQDLHYIHFGMIYYAAAKNASFKGWKIPKMIEVPKAIVNFSFQATPRRLTKSLLAKVSKIDRENGEAFNSKEFEDSRRYYEKERAKYRNYRTANSLHT